MNIPNYDDDGPIAEPARPPMQWITTQQPLTKRERFAMAAMQGVCGSQNWNGNIADTAKDAVTLADALIAALNSTPEPK